MFITNSDTKQSSYYRFGAFSVQPTSMFFHFSLHQSFAISPPTAFSFEFCFFPLLSTNFISFPFNFFNIGNRLASPTTPDVPCPFPNQYSSFWKLFGIENNKLFVILKPRHAYYYRCFPRSAILLWFTGGRNAFSNIRSAFCATTFKTSFSQVQEPNPPILSVAFAAPSPS